MSISSSEFACLKAGADTNILPYAYGGPCGSAVMRCRPEDFQVSESTGLIAKGTGEHLLLRVRKTGQNTRWVAKRLAEHFNVPYKAISYAGMKDRHAVTEQWFSAHLPGKPDPLLADKSGDGFEILDSVRHDRKLRPGQLSYNRFHIVLRECEVTDKNELNRRIADIAVNGVPNYFGPQRFGRNQANLALADTALAVRKLNREQRSFCLSALRGALFNAYLADRVVDASWNRLLSGEVQLSDRPRGVAEHDRSLFSPERLPSGLLWGKGNSAAAGQALSAESQFFARFPGTTALLAGAGSQVSRRVLKLRVAGLAMRQHDDRIHLEFALGPGGYATVVLRELFQLRDYAGMHGAAD